MAAGKKSPEEKEPDRSGSGHSLRDDAEEQLAQSRKSSSDLAGQTPEQLIHELQVHQIELEMQAEELRRAHLKLEESRDKYLDLYDFAPLGYLSLSDKALITNVNLTGASLLGEERRDLLNARFSKFVAEPDGDEWHRYFMRVLDREEKLTATLSLKRGDGTVFPARLEGVRIPGTGDGAPTVRVAISDITDIRRAEDALRQSEERLKLAHKATREVVWDWDVLTDTQQWNEAGTAVFGWTEIVERPVNAAWWVARVHPEDRERVHDEFFAVVDNPETDYWSDEYRFLKTDGSYAAVLDRGYVLRDENGRAYRMIGAMQDITERKRAEGALRESEEKFRTLFEHAPVLIDGFDHNGRCTLWNKECERIFGWSQDEINSHDEPLALFYPDPIVRGQVIESVTSSPGTRFKEWHPMTREGKVLTVLWANFLLPEGSIINIGHDITERKHYEDVLTLAHRFFSISTQHQQIAPMLDEVVHTIQEYTGCEAVGIRLLDAAGNIPYPAYTGFDRSFYERESPLNILRDECMCIYIIRGDANPDLPVITQKGSFYCNGTTKFLAGISDEEKGRTRNVCNEEGYESVALVAIKRGDETIGLIHIADHREGMVPLETVKVLEDISQALGSAIQRLLAETGIRQALEEKEVLLREVHHRVKNNLAGILSLIGLQINSLSDPQQIAQLKELENRIRSMAQVHDSLSRTKDLARINVASYTENLTRHLLPASGTEGKVRYRIDMGDVVLPIETATPCGLVMNEIITNSLKYAFPKTFSCEEIRGEPCTITLTLHREGNDYLLGISDNGIGIPEGIGVTKSHTLGLFLIRFIVEHQLRGSIEISTKRGTAYMIRFRVPPVIEGKDYEKM